MSTISTSPMSSPLAPPAYLPISIASSDSSGEVPGWVRDHESFRRWARSEEYPRRGWYAFLGGTLWVDISMEQLFTHNLVKAAISGGLDVLVRSLVLGYLFVDRTKLSHPHAVLTTEPDLTFAFWETAKSGKLRFVEGEKRGYVELEGSPDMTLEIVSDSSVKKDNVILLDLYWKAGVREYWLVDARTSPLEFQIYRHTPTGYEPQPICDKGVFSPVFQRYFRLHQGTDPLGHPSYRLQVEA